MLIECGDCAVDPAFIVTIRPSHNGVRIVLRDEEIWCGMPDYATAVEYCARLRDQANAAMAQRTNE